MRGCLIGLIIIVCVLMPLYYAASFGSDALFDAPWAYPLLGRPTMTGTWEGEFTTPSGVHFAILLDLQRGLLENGRPHTEDILGAIIDGRASWCDNHGRHADRVVINGQVPVFQGYTGTAKDVELDLESTANPQKGLLPMTLMGTWNSDTLSMQVAFQYWTGTTFEYSGNNPDLTKPTSVTLKKSDQGVYERACGGL